MPFDLSTLPISGGVILGGIVVAAVGFLFTGPLVADRTTRASGWQQQCQKMVADEIRSNAPQPEFMPEIGCETFTKFLGSRNGAGCDLSGSPFDNPILDQFVGVFDSVSKIQKQKERIRRERIERAVSKTADRCSCASSLMQEEHRVAWVTYSLSARAITPTSIKNLKSELVSALHSPECARMVQ